MELVCLKKMSSDRKSFRQVGVVGVTLTTRNSISCDGSIVVASSIADCDQGLDAGSLGKTSRSYTMFPFSSGHCSSNLDRVFFPEELENIGFEVPVQPFVELLEPQFHWE